MLVIFTPENTNLIKNTNLNSFFEEGLERLHIRFPEKNKAYYQNFIEKINPLYYSKIFVHQHHDLVNLYSLGGKHFRNKDIKSLKITTYKNASTGVHSLADFETKKKFFEHVFLSPLFKSISKPDYFTKTNLNISQFSKEDKEKAIALGGVDKHTIFKAKELGFKNFAVLGAVWQSENPIAKFIHLKKLARKA